MLGWRVRILARAHSYTSPRKWREEVAFTAGFALTMMVLFLQRFPQIEGFATAIAIVAGMCYVYSAILWLNIGE
jgi:hypothetical protein